MKKDIIIRFIIIIFIGLFLSFGSSIAWRNPGFWDGIPLIPTGILLFGFGMIVFTKKIIRFLFRKKHSSSDKPPSPRTSFAKIDWGIFAMAIVGLVILYGIAWKANHQPLSSSAPKLLVFGLDGATWDLIDPWIQNGDLNHIEELSQKGARGVLESLDPMESPDLWTSIATGIPPEQHGVNGFFADRGDLKVNRVWDIGARYGLTTGLYAWLVSWPPHDPFTFIIPDWMAHSPETKPVDYEAIQELKLDQSRYGGPAEVWKALGRCGLLGARLLSLERMAYFYWNKERGLSEEERMAGKLLAEPRMEADLFLALLRRFKPDIATFSLYGTDKLGHRFWHCMNPDAFPNLSVSKDSPFQNVIHDYYQQADRQLGRILSVLPTKCNVVMVSDHGFKADPAAPRQFFLDCAQLLETLGHRRFIHYTSIQRHYQFEPAVPDAEMMKQLKHELETIHFQGSDDPVFDVELDDQDKIGLRTNFSLSWNLESPILENPTILLQEKPYPTEQFFFLRTFSGTHDPRGIVAMQGPAIRPGSAIFNAGILDIAPTLLYLLDLPISRELPGRILEEAIDSDYWKNHPPHYIDSYGPAPEMPPDTTDIPESLMEHLRSLDYVK